MQYFEPYPWEKIKLPEVVEGDLDDIPAAGKTGTRSDTNPIGKFPDNQKRMWSAYYASTMFMDEQVGRILDELDKLGLRESTAVVFTSDHGYHLGEHMFWQKVNLHEEVTRVPLIISVPGMKPGRSESIVELMDIYPTLSELAGLPIPKEVQGSSLVPILKDPAAKVKPGALSFVGRGASLRGERWAYMRYNGGDEELYDMDEDSKQFTNLANNPEYAPQKKEIRATWQKRMDLVSDGKKK